METSVLYSDEYITVCNKPSGKLSQRDVNGENGLCEELSESYGSELHIINRLDRPVSGLTLLANNKASAAALTASLGDHDVFIKEYLVCVSGILEKDAAILEDQLFRDRTSGKTLAISSKRAGSKYAKLAYSVIATAAVADGSPVSLLLVRLFTGRTHQIRAQLASRGHPVLGDGKYGSRVKLKNSIALHCFRISFPHPCSKKRISFSALPENSGGFAIFTEQIERLLAETSPSN